MKKSNYALLVLAIAGLNTVSPAFAQERQREVSYSDLDLSTEAGQAQFKKRILRAVRNVCALPPAKTASEHADQAACETNAKSSAMRTAGKVIARYGSSVKVALD
jgi:UrcA family protein